MKNVTKLDTAHAAKFGISGVSGSFYSLIDRLQVHSEWKYPNRKWNNDTYYGILFDPNKFGDDRNNDWNIIEDLLQEQYKGEGATIKVIEVTRD